ncbi:MAG: hypothetical protein K1X54_01160 [Flavobacteriales bacterium]|nr:hypothetical protein [Flavobacteriales bacterium]
MSRLILIIFISYQVNVLTEFHELFRLPLLIEHFLDHKETNGDLGLLDFLVLHYSSESKDADSDEDAQLPFKSREDGMHHVSLSTVIPSENLHLQFQSFPVSLSYISSYQKRDHNGAEKGIWQPPQLI